MLVTINNNTWTYKNKNVTGLLQSPVPMNIDYKYEINKW